MIEFWAAVGPLVENKQIQNTRMCAEKERKDGR